MHDFDKERRERHGERERELGDRSFTLGGETFTYLANPSYTVLEQVASVGEVDGAAVIRQLEDAALELIEFDERKRFQKVLRSTKDPITFSDLNEIVGWITGAQTGRPTEAFSPSTAGDATISTSSTDDSSSKPAVVSAA